MSDPSTTDVALVPDAGQVVALEPRQVVRGGLPRPDELAVIQKVAEMYIQSGILPREITKWQHVAVIAMTGRDLGIPISYAVQKIYVISGRPACEASLMAALIYRDHGDGALVPVECTATRATFRYKRRGWTEYREHTFTIEDAERAGLIKKGGTWTQYPADMLRSRCVSQIGRMAFPDTIGGLYTTEEAESIAAVDIGPATVIETTASPSAPSRQTARARRVAQPTDAQPTDAQPTDARAADAPQAPQDLQRLRALVNARIEKGEDPDEAIWELATGAFKVEGDLGTLTAEQCALLTNAVRECRRSDDLATLRNTIREFAEALTIDEANAGADKIKDLGFGEHRLTLARAAYRLCLAELETLEADRAGAPA